jgi:hypothetical protein
MGPGAMTPERDVTITVPNAASKPTSDNITLHFHYSIKAVVRAV